MIEVIAYHIDVPENLLSRLIAEGYISECSKHGYEVTAGRNPDELEERLDELDPPIITELTESEERLLDGNR